MNELIQEKTLYASFQSIEFEELFLACILLDHSVIPQYTNISPSVFSTKTNQDCWAIILGFWSDWKTFDTILLLNELRKAHQWIDSYVWSLQALVLTNQNINEYLDIVIEMSKRRELYKIIQTTTLHLQNSSADAIAYINSQINQSSWTGKNTHDLFEVLTDLVDNSGKKANIICKTGYTSLDEKIQWFREWQLIVISGRPGMGKTMFAVNLLYKNMVDWQNAVYFSLEMSAIEITQRIMAKGARVCLTKIAGGDYSKEEEEKLIKAYQTYAFYEPQIKIETRVFKLEEILLKIRSHHILNGTLIFYIDQLQRIKVSGKERVFELEKITNELKNIASELWIVVILLCQLRRSQSHELPKLSELKGSWSIEEDADIVLFPHRDNYWDSDQIINSIRVIIAKNRNGEETECLLWLHQKYMHIHNL